MKYYWKHIFEIQHSSKILFISKVYKNKLLFMLTFLRPLRLESRMVKGRNILTQRNAKLYSTFIKPRDFNSSSKNSKLKPKPLGCPSNCFPSESVNDFCK
jgi:hypothetical protein